MVKITYTNGDVQHVNVTADFFTITVAEKNGNKNYKFSPMEKAEGMALDFAQLRGAKVATVELFYPGNTKPKVKTFAPLDEREVPEVAKPTKSFLRELKKMKRKGKADEKAGLYTKWKWTF